MRTQIGSFSRMIFCLGIFSMATQAQEYATLSSTVTYWGHQTGAVWAAASLNRANLVAPAKLAIPQAGPFTNAPLVLPNLLPGGTYYVFAWRDMDGNGAPGLTEPQGWHPQAFSVTTNCMVPGFVIEDPDSNFDELPDWWQARYGLAPQSGHGSSGALTVDQGETVFTDTVWASVLGANPTNSPHLNVSTTNGFAKGDLAMIITMQDTNTDLARNTAGIYEFGRIASLSSNTITFALPRTNAFDVGTSRRTQVLKVPEYTEVVLSGPALRLDGVSDYVDVPDGVFFNGNFTVESWVKVRAYTSWSRLLDFGNGQNANNVICAISELTTGRPALSLHTPGSTEVIAPDPLPLNQWVHLAFTLNGTVGRIMVNGVVVATNPTMTPPEGLVRVNNFIGRSNWSSDGYAGADFRDIRIWNVARTVEEIQANMNVSLSGTQENLVALWPCDEGVGTTIRDLAANHYNGTLMSSPEWIPGGSITCQPWNGTNGGVLALSAHKLTVQTNASISADGKGYRGGPNVPDSGASYSMGNAGERTTGFSLNRDADCLERPQGGGGAGKGADGSGGGGSYGGAGANGAKALSASDYGRGANPYGVVELNRLYPGGGGGSSGSHDAGRVGVAGGAGGGVVLIWAGLIQGSGTISSCGFIGSAGRHIYDSNSGSGGGGGAGGSVYLIGDAAPSVGILATGGPGGPRATSTSNSRDGGAGGEGRIRLDLPPGGTAPTAQPLAGYVTRSPKDLSILWANIEDSDQDGLSDLREYQLLTSPITGDTDGDTLPDKWETDFLLNPLFADDAAASQDFDGDGVSNTLELYRGTRPDMADSDGDGLSDSQELFVYYTDPMSQDTDQDGMSDSLEVQANRDPLSKGTQYYYDRLERLVGAQYENGLGLGYQYDANNNLLRQVYTKYDANTNALPDVWEFLNGLTNNASGFVDTDGDGWSDWQEWKNANDPRDPQNRPDAFGSAGVQAASLVLPFTPLNFVVGVGQLDGFGPEEIVLGADGYPGTTTNFLLVLSQTATGWSTQRLDIGSFGVTSLAIGQPANRPTPCIYAGLRETGGKGSIVEFSDAGGSWTSNCVALSLDEAAYVLGVRAQRDLIVSFTTTNAPPGSAHYMQYSSGWTSTLADTNASQHGLGLLTATGVSNQKSRGLRFLDSGAVEVLGHDVQVPTNAIWNEDYSRWFFLTPSLMTWPNAQAYASNNFGGNLATINDATLNTWLWNQFKSIGYFWNGLRRDSLAPIAGPWVWASGSPVTYVNWAAGEPNNLTSECLGGVLPGNGAWNNWPLSSSLQGAVEVKAVERRSVQAAAPAARPLVWRGHSVNSGNLRPSGSQSILSTCADDINDNHILDAGDELVFAEYLFSGSSLSPNFIQRIPLSGASLAQSYGLASVDVLYGQEQIVFTAEPDGCLYSWTASDTAPLLQRRLFSAQHTGKAWHGLAGVRTQDEGQSLLGMRVDPATPNRCDLILWPPQQALPELSEVPQTAPVTQILPSPALGRDVARVSLRISDSEGSPSWPTLAYQHPVTAAWSNATVAAVNGAVTGFVRTDPAGVTNLVDWDAARDLGPGFTNTVLLRARSHDSTLTGPWSPSFAYVVQNSLGNNPRANPDYASTSEGVPVDIDVLANDIMGNGAPKLIANVGTPANGSAAINPNKTIHYAPAPLFSGTDSFTYTLTDGAGAYSLATVTVLVTPGSGSPITLTAPTLQGGQFRMNICGAAGCVYQVQTSTNLISWSAVRMLTNVSGTVQCVEPLQTNAPVRFYRVLQQ